MQDYTIPPTISSYPSYHDIVVTVNGKDYRIADNYAYHLTCTKCGGWNLWYQWMGEERLIGGEFNGDKEFIIRVGEIVVCLAKVYDEDGEEVETVDRKCEEEIGEGWDGRIVN